MNDMSDRVRKGRKFDQVVDGARQVFLDVGFDGASVDEIARVAGVSKATLYSYFPDKRLLFMEVAKLQCQAQATAALQTIDLHQPPRVILRQMGQKFLTFIVSDFGLRMFRVCVSEADRFPELGQQFYNSGPVLVRKIIMEYLQEAQARGEVHVDNFQMAADQFSEMCKTTLWVQILCGVKAQPTQEEIDAIIDEAVDTFLARYGT